MSEQQKLEDIFWFIKKSLSDLRTFASSTNDDNIEVRLQQLKATSENVGAKPKKRPPPMEIYMGEWGNYVAGHSKSLSRGAIRYLCWEPEIATTEKFLNSVESSSVELSPRALQGLVRSCHQLWSNSLVTAPPFKKIRSLIQKYSGLNQVLRKWKLNLDQVLDAHAPYSLSTHFVRNGGSLTKFFEDWHFDTQSRFVQEMVCSATGLCRDQLGAGSKNSEPDMVEILFAELLPWRGWDVSDFKNHLSNLILERCFDRIQGQLLSFILSHKDLGDPRLPRNRQKWLAVPQAAIARLLELLCREDISFFFDHVIPTSQDRQNRKQFWLQYVRRCTASRPLLSFDDRIRLKPVLQQHKLTVGHFGELRTRYNSAFLLRFDNITVVDFSIVGACFIYDSREFQRVIPDFWARDSFTESGLKRGSYIDRIIHRKTANSDWRTEARQVLAAHGIRP
jgi:hypothetical protein